MAISIITPIITDNHTGLLTWGNLDVGSIYAIMNVVNKLEFINKRSFDGLVKKIRNKYSSDRLGFRENMSFILGISYYYLQKNLY